VRYLHVVFTLPRVLSQLALHNKKLLYSLLLKARAQTLLTVARDPRHLGAEIGFFSILHTWKQRLQATPRHSSSTRCATGPIATVRLERSVLGLSSVPAVVGLIDGDSIREDVYPQQRLQLPLPQTAEHR